MDYLERLKQRLKHKQEVIPDIPLKVHTSEVQKKKTPKSNIVKKTNITVNKDKEEEQLTNITANKEKEKDKEKQSTNITANKDKGELSVNILEKIKQQKMSRFAKPLEEIPQQPSQAPIIEENKINKLKKIDENIIISEEDENIIISEELALPEGGPRLEEMIPVEKVMEEDDFKTNKQFIEEND